jgi:hypothetical protein
VKDRLEGDEYTDVLFDDDITKRPADFQRVAVKSAVQISRHYGGGFVPDVVGLSEIIPVRVPTGGRK